MAKKQIIILSHGSGTPTVDKFNGLGEVLVQHGTGATETMLYTLDANSGVTSFPSTAWVNGKITEVNGAAAALEGRVDALETSAATLDSKIDTKYAAATAYTDNQIAALRGSFDGTIEALEDVVETKADATALTETNNAVSALEGRVEVNEGKLATLIGGDADKSVRAIANEELAAQLIAESASTSLDTLKEIADWIQQHPKDAAAMNTAIEANASAITTEVSDRKVAVEAAEARIKVIEDDYLKASDKNELNELITAETANREAAVKAVDDKLGTGFTAENTVAKAIADEVAAREGAVAGVQGQVDTINAAYIKSIVVKTGDDENDKADVTIENNVATIDLSVIDGGEY